MTDVLYVPKLTNNLFSVHTATSKRNTVSFKHKDYCIRNKNRKVIGTGSSLGKLYKLDCEVQQLPTENAMIAEGPVESTSKIDLWHQRLAHVNLKQLHQQVESSNGVDMQSQGKLNFCEACVQGKCHQKPHLPEVYQIKGEASISAIRIHSSLLTSAKWSIGMSKLYFVRSSQVNAVTCWLRQYVLG